MLVLLVMAVTDSLYEKKLVIARGITDKMIKSTVNLSCIFVFMIKETIPAKVLLHTSRSLLGNDKNDFTKTLPLYKVLGDTV